MNDDFEMPAWQEHQPVAAYVTHVDYDELYRLAERDEVIFPTQLAWVCVYEVDEVRYLVELYAVVARNPAGGLHLIEVGDGRWARYDGRRPPRMERIPGGRLPDPGLWRLNLAALIAHVGGGSADRARCELEGAVTGRLTERVSHDLRGASRTNDGGWRLVLNEPGHHVIEVPALGLLPDVQPAPGDELRLIRVLSAGPAGGDRVLVNGRLLWRAPTRRRLWMTGLGRRMSELRAVLARRGRPNAGEARRHH